MSKPPPSIPARLNILDKRMRRIEDAITAKGIKFVDRREEYDYIPATKVMDYVHDLVRIRRNWRNVYNWIRKGLVDRNGKRVYLRCDALIRGGGFYVRKLWVREFLDKIRKGSI